MCNKNVNPGNKEITLSYYITGNEKDAKKIKRAVSLSMYYLKVIVYAK